MILFVDDDKRDMESFYEELKLSGYNVDFHSDVDAAFAAYQKNLDRIELLILDVMMPPGKEFEQEKVNGGLRTGLRFYERVRSLDAELQIIIFTNLSDEPFMESFANDERCCVLQKEDYLPFELANFITEILQTGK